MGSLSARCSVVACANPVSGHYNRSRTILENIKVSNAILSRFDMVFLLLDDPDL
jgi:DNA helicase MCM8